MLHTIPKLILFRRLSYNTAFQAGCTRFSHRAVSRCTNYFRGYAVQCTGKRLNKQSSVLCQSLIPNFTSRIGVQYSTTQELTTVQFEKISDETLESLTEYLDELIEQAGHLSEADVSFGDGVLTVKFGDPYGTYVINRQTPNRQIWLSSPKSGPKRYDFIDGKWIYKHDGKSLHELLNEEIPSIIKSTVSFDRCSFSGKDPYTAKTSL